MKRSHECEAKGNRGLIDKGRTRTYLPPAVLIDIVFLDDFYALAGTKGDLVCVLGDKVIAGINVFDHL